MVEMMALRKLFRSENPDYDLLNMILEHLMFFGAYTYEEREQIINNLTYIQYRPYNNIFYDGTLGINIYIYIYNIMNR